MKKIIKYIAIDPYYSDVTQTYIGSSVDEIDNIQYETEQFMKNCHSSLSMIYKRETILDEGENLI